jgi:hypothetical protein
MGNIDGAKQCTAAMNSEKNAETLYDEMQKEHFDFNTLM